MLPLNIDYTAMTEAHWAYRAIPGAGCSGLAQSTEHRHETNASAGGH
jgi:hypothetical protein